MTKYLYQRVVQDFQGNIISGAAVTVKITGTSTSAQLYSDAAGLNPITQPVYTNANGQALFYVDAGLYDIEASKGLQVAPKLVGVDVGFSTEAGVSANNAAAAANASAAGFNYRGLWPDSGGSATKGETWQTQIGGAPTGKYFTALKNTTATPVNDNVNWKAQNDYGTIADGLVVEHRRGAAAEIAAGTPAIGELWFNTTDNSIHMGDGATPGGVKHLNADTGIVLFKASGSNSAVENMITGVPYIVKVGDVCSTGYTKWVVESLSSPMTLNDFRAVSDIYAYDFNIQSNSTVPASDIQPIVDASNSSKKPVNFDHVANVNVTGQLLIDSFFHIKSSDKSIKRLTFTEDTRTGLGSTKYGYVVKRDETVGIDFAMVEDIWVDFSNSRSGLIPIENTIQGFLFTSRGAGTVDKDLIAMRAKFTNPRGDCFKAETYDGGLTRGVRMLFCDGDVDSPGTSSLRSNMIRTFNGDEGTPGEYGVYTISDVTVFGNRCRGMRSLSDLKRGTEGFTISENTTVDMSDVHHSTDGSRGGVFSASNRGTSGTDSTQAVKNFYEIQGEDIDVEGGVLVVDPLSPLNMTGGILVTDYAYPAENGTGVGNRRNQSVNVNIYGGTFNEINNHAVRMINTKDCIVENIKATDCLFDAVSFEEVTGLVDKDSNPIVPANNYCDKIKAQNCRRPVSTQHTGVTFGPELIDSNGQFDIYNYESGLYRFNFAPENLNKNENFVDFAGGTSPLYWSTGGNAVIYTVESDIPVGGEYAIAMEDNRTDTVMPSNYSGKIPMSINKKLFFKLLMKSSNTTRCGILVREYDSGDSILNTEYLDFDISSSWESYTKRYVCETMNTAYVKLIITPADYLNSPTAVGKVFLSKLQVGSKAF